MIMSIVSFLRNIKGRITGFNATAARFDILQSKLDGLSLSLNALETSVENVSNRLISNERIDHLESKLDDQSSSLNTLERSIETVSNRLISNEGIDHLESKLDDQSSSLKTLERSIENVSNRLISNERIDHLQFKLDDLSSSLITIETSVRKFAFLVHDPVMLIHYADVWKEMDPANFTIVLTEFFYFDEDGNERLGLSDFFNHVLTAGYEIRKSIEIISCGIKFDYVVTNHVISGSTESVKPDIPENYFKKLHNRFFLLMGKEPLWKFGVDIYTYLPLQIGRKQIRYMYGADISEGWSLQSWNNIYDVFLCHGVNDEREIKKRFRGETFIMGYPRYDRFFAGTIDLNNIKREFGIVESRKTLLWMPTLGGDYSSIPLFAESLSTLRDRYNIIVRPHPLSFLQEKDFITLLEKFNFNIDRNALRDTNELFSIADVVLADNGGTPFSAIFLGRNVVFLDVPTNTDSGSAASHYILGSSVLALKNHLPVVKPKDMQRLIGMLDSDLFYIENSKCIEMLFKEYFDSPRGGGGKRVVEIFSRLN